MALKGDFGKLVKIRAQVGRMADPMLMARLARVVGAEALTQVQLGFRQSRDPYGEAWAPLTRREGKPLLDTGRLRNSFSYRVHGGHFVVGTNVEYAAAHQFGTNGRRVASSRSMPTDESGRFMSRKSAGVKKGRKVQALWHSFKRLNFKVGGGKIPARPMMPTGSRGLGKIWQEAFDETARRFLSRLMRG